MKRVFIVGISGSGKSTLAFQLSKIVNLPLIHLDKYFWKPNWEFPDLVEWMGELEELSDGPSGLLRAIIALPIQRFYPKLTQSFT